MLGLLLLGSVAGVTPPHPNNSKHWYEKLVKMENICLKLKVKVGKIWSKFEIKDGQICLKKLVAILTISELWLCFR
jgi:methyl coenzyme M reductase subunit D